MADSDDDLLVDDARMKAWHMGTLIYVRARRANGEWGSYDLGQLDRASLIRFLDGKPHAWVRDALLATLGHKP